MANNFMTCFEGTMAQTPPPPLVVYLTFYLILLKVGFRTFSLFLKYMSKLQKLQLYMH